MGGKLKPKPKPTPSRYDKYYGNLKTDKPSSSRFDKNKNKKRKQNSYE